jgi:hypothetical protein
MAPATCQACLHAKRYSTADNGQTQNQRTSPAYTSSNTEGNGVCRGAVYIKLGASYGERAESRVLSPVRQWTVRHMLMLEISAALIRVYSCTAPREGR